MKSLKAASKTTTKTSGTKTAKNAGTTSTRTPAKAARKSARTAPANGQSDFNVHLIVPEGSGIDSENVKVTVKDMQLVIELQSGGGEAANQVQGVKKVPVPPRPNFPIDDILEKLAFKFTMSKKVVR